MKASWHWIRKVNEKVEIIVVDVEREVVVGVAGVVVSDSK